MASRKIGPTGLEDLTVILTLRDRADFTRPFLKWHRSCGLKILILDASSSDSNFEICQHFVSRNIVYIRTPVDRSVRHHLQKLSNNLKEIDTANVILVDNDDFLLPKGLRAAQIALNEKAESIAAGGPVLGFKGRGRPPVFASWPYRIWNEPTSSSTWSAICASRTDYQAIWYSVYRCSELIRILDEVVALGIEDPYLIEFAMCDLTLAVGPYLNSAWPHYLRMVNQTDRSIHLVPELLGNNWEKRAWFEESLHFDRRLALKLQKPLQDLPTNALRWALLSNVPSTSSSFARQTLVFLRLLFSSITVWPMFALVFISRYCLRP